MVYLEDYIKRQDGEKIITSLGKTFASPIITEESNQSTRWQKLRTNFGFETWNLVVYEDSLYQVAADVIIEYSTLKTCLRRGEELTAAIKNKKPRASFVCGFNCQRDDDDEILCEKTCDPDGACKNTPYFY